MAGEDGRIHHTLADVVVRSKSEVIIANMLHERGISFRYERPLRAPDGTFYLPDFTITLARCRSLLGARRPNPMTRITGSIGKRKKLGMSGFQWMPNHH